MNLLTKLAAALLLLALLGFGLHAAQFGSSGILAQGNLTITAAPNGYIVSNITQINLFSFTINGTLFRAYVSSITPTTAVVSLNNGSYYGIQLNQPYLIKKSSEYNFYAKLINTSAFTKPPTVSIYFYSTMHQPAPLVNVTYNLMANTPVTLNIPNMSASIKLSSGNSGYATLLVSNATVSTAPAGYKPLIVLNVSTKSSLNLTSTLIFRYSCQLPSSSIAPFVLRNNSWDQISAFSVNSSACTIAFNVPADPIIGVFQSEQTTSISTTASTTTKASTSITTLTTIPTVPKAISYAPYVIVVAIILLAFFYYVYLQSRRDKKGQQPPKADNASKPVSDANPQAPPVKPAN